LCCSLTGVERLLVMAWPTFESCIKGWTSLS
jgi:hypothetical protein